MVPLFHSGEEIIRVENWTCHREESVECGGLQTVPRQPTVNLSKGSLWDVAGQAQSTRSVRKRHTENSPLYFFFYLFLLLLQNTKVATQFKEDGGGGGGTGGGSGGGGGHGVRSEVGGVEGKRL